ncbi:MAG: Flp pilus assembly complex ATPase component TadA [Candidatus Moduliflexus flocculans]|nr:Flp pilus assembly complex ATPase component TadA [Candidatus Moduliflexus flocculans]
MVKETDEGGEQTVSLEKLGDASSPVVRLVNTTLVDALAKRASDIHIETYDEGRDRQVPHRRRAVPGDGRRSTSRHHSADHLAASRSWPSSTSPRSACRRTGASSCASSARDIDFRVSIMPSGARRGRGHPHPRQGVDHRAVCKSLRLDMPRLRRAEVLKQVPQVASASRTAWCWSPARPAAARPRRSTPACPRSSRAEDKIITIEDPVEYQLDGIAQIPVNEKKGLTFARGLRSILRHDPDKIMVGEIRDAETAQIAVQSALTGHLVFTTVHANNVFDVLGRFAAHGRRTCTTSSRRSTACWRSGWCA